MTFAEDYQDYQYWKQHLDDSPESWERQAALEKDADFYRDNKSIIDEALEVWYRIRTWWADPSNERTNEVTGDWFRRSFGAQLDQRYWPDDDDTPF